MGFLANILLALASLAVHEAGVEAPLRWPVAAPLLCLVPPALAGVARRLALRGRWRAAARVQRLVGKSAPLLQAAAVLLFGWSAAVEDTLATELDLFGWPGPVLLLGLLPYVVYELAAIDARVRLADDRPQARRDARRFQVRMLLASLTPLVGYAALATLVGIDPRVRAHVEEVALLDGMVSVLLLGAFALVLPSVLRRAWDTARLEAGAARDVLEATARAAGFRCKELLVWRTGNLMANAAVVGFTPRNRLVLFSDALLDQLGPGELAAVFAHEIGHARRGHALVFASWAVAFFLGADLILHGLGLGSALGEVLFLAGWVALGAVGFGYVARRFELDADLESVRVTGDGEALVRALEQVGGAHARRESSWRHFSVHDRVRFIGSVVADPEVGRRMRRRLSAFAWGGGAVLAACLGLEALRLAGTWTADRVAVDLRLGRYAAAAERAAGAELEPDVAALVARGAGLGDGVDAGRLDAEARAALAAGDLGAAEEWLSLAEIRGARGLAEAREAIALLAAGEREAAFRVVAGAPPEWDTALREAVRGAVRER